jgi:hypothetical protein
LTARGNTPQWSEKDREIEQQFAAVISIVWEQNTPESVPLSLTFVVLLFFSIAMIWLSF